jgi:flagellar biosynthetic protein FliR
MPDNLTLSITTLYGFLLVLARVAGVFVFVPLPGVRSGPEIARIVLALTLTLALFPQWPAVDPQAGMGRLTGWVLAEAGLGIAVGVAVSMLIEAFVLAAQILGLQAGYAYASTIDPTTQADSSILLVFAQLTAGLLFFALGLDREVIRAFARSLETQPAGSFVLTRPAAEQVLRLGSDMFSTGLRLALPVTALLILVDVALALVGRINAHLQLLTLAFPVKMLLALLMLAWVMALFPAVFRNYGGNMLGVVRGLTG